MKEFLTFYPLSLLKRKTKKCPSAMWIWKCTVTSTLQNLLRVPSPDCNLRDTFKVSEIRKEAETLQDFLSAPRQKSGDATGVERKQTPSKQTGRRVCRVLGGKRELFRGQRNTRK